MQVKLSELRKIVTFLKTSEKLKSLKLAIVVNTPEKTVLPMLAVRYYSKLELRAFSEIKTAIRWILE